MPSVGEKKRRRPRKQLSEVHTLKDLLDCYEVDDSWDAVIVGDGSGTTRKHTCGWGAVLVEKGEPSRTPFGGGFSSGTNNVAEMMAVLQPLMDLSARKRGSKSLGLQVHVFSDSDYVVNGLERDSPLWASTVRSNRELWLALHGARRNGLVIYPHHVPRDTLALQKVCHDLANSGRVSQQGLLEPFEQRVEESNP